MEKKNQWKTQGRFFITKSHTRGYSYCKLSFSYFTKKKERKQPNKEKHTKMRKNITSIYLQEIGPVFCMKHVCVCNLFLL